MSSPWEAPGGRARARWPALAALAALVLVVGIIIVDDDGPDGNAAPDSREEDAIVVEDSPEAGAPPEPEETPGPLGDTEPVGAWRDLPQAPLEARYAALDAWTGEALLVIGGQGASATLADGAAFDPEADAWREIAEAPAALRRPDVADAWTGHELLAWGVDEDREELGLGYDPDADAWRELPPAPIGPRRHHVAAWTGEVLLVWGGRGLDGAPLGDGAAYDPRRDAWRRLPARDGERTEPRGLAVAVWAEHDDCDPVCGELLIWGQAAEGDAWPGVAYHPERMTWRAVEALPRAVGSGTPSLTWAGDRALMCCGFDGGARLGGYHPADDAWRDLGVSPIGRRTQHVQEWTGEALVAWGGRIRDRWIRANGGAYDVADDAWLSLPDAGAELARIRPVSAWTGDELLVWGGLDDARGPRADGARWSPHEPAGRPTHTGQRADPARRRRRTGRLAA